MDDELKSLFEQLDDEDEQLVQPAQQSPVIFSEPEPALKPVEIAKVPLDNLPPPNQPEVSSSSVDVNKKMQQLEEVTDNILSACSDDRRQAQEAIDLIKGEICKNLENDQRPPAAFVEGLIKAIEVKAGINLTAVKIMEANAKMLAATKAGASISVNNNNSLSNASLTDILSQPMTPMDEF